MTSDDQRAPIDPDDDDGESHAADEPTAVWDESALRAAGLSDLLSKRDSAPPPPPATAPVSSSAQDQSIVVDQESLVPKNPPTPVPEAPERLAPQEGGLGWGATLAIAVLLGALVYGLIRYLKG